MAKKHKLTGKGVSVPIGILIGTISSVVAAMIGGLILSWFVVRGVLDAGKIGAGAIVITALASAVGALISTALVKGRKLLVCGLTAMAFYLVLLIITAVFFDGTYSGMGLAALIVIVGAGLSLLSGVCKKAGKNKIKIPVYR